MSFLDTVRRAKTYLEEQGRVSLRALKREFELDDEALDDLIEELVEIQRVAVRDRRALAWAGGVPPAPTETPEHERAPRAASQRRAKSKREEPAERCRATRRSRARSRRSRAKSNR